ncbi:MAG: glycosyltransferase family 39 protein [Saccharofermentans sp.]|nr:glycosyltransferase family 39 protein [Saccharofermentans sp.]
MSVKLINKSSMKMLDRKMFYASLVLALYNFVITLLMYLDVVPNNFLTFYTWPLSITLLIIAFRKTDRTIFRKFTVKDPLLIALAIVTVVYFVSHLYNFTNAPWNAYGLFDDAAWDIFDARKMCYTSDRFELIFWDANIGIISRELIFHYYISILFRLFGYNLVVFNIGLMLLGFITVLFTTLTAYEFKKDPVFACAAGLFLNFYPLHFTQVFMGHRYAICGPLLMASFYFIVRAFKKNKFRSAVLGGIFAGLAMGSAIMGKQYIYGLIASGVLILIHLVFKNKTMIKEFISLTLLVLSGFAAATTHLFAYIFTHWELYGYRESSITKDFLENLKNEGFKVIAGNLKDLYEVLFSKSSALRQFSSDCAVLRWEMVFLLVIGIVVLLARRNISPVILAAIPFAGCIITRTYDFRILIAAPFLCYIMCEGGFTLVKFIFEKLKMSKNIHKYVASGLLLVITIPHFSYLKKLADNPNSQYHLPHYSVAASRYMSDLAIGSEDPNIEMKSDEFNRANTNDRYDLLACVENTFAHVHAFIGGEYSRQILSLCGDFPYTSRTEKDMRPVVSEAIQNYQINNKDLMLAFEMGGQVENIVNDLIDTGLCDVSYDEFNIDGNEIRFCKLYITNDNIALFKEASINIAPVESE